MQDTYDKLLLKSLGEDVFISNHCEIKRPHLVTLGNHVCIDSGFYITTGAEIADYVHIGPYVSIIGGETGLLKMGNFTNIAVGSKLICGSDAFLGEGFSFPVLPIEYRDDVIIKPIIIEDFAGIGANVTIMPGVRIAEGSVIGACSLVTKDTEPWTIYYGVPAKPIKIRAAEKMLRLAKKLGY